MVRKPTSAVPCPVCGSGRSTPVWDEDGYQLVRCAGCDLTFLGNPPDEEALRALYSFEGEFHTQYADGSQADPSERKAYQAHLDLMEAEQAPGELLDIGCAAGHFLVEARSRGWSAHGVELNPDTSRIARERFGLDVTTGMADDPALEGRTFDAVTLWDVIEHVPDPVGLLESAHRLLSPTGRLWLATPNIDGLFPQASLKVAGRVGRWPHPEPPYHLVQFSVDTIRSTLARAGFRTIAVDHERIPISYTFGSPGTVLTDPKRLAYTAVFAPLALAGPVVHRGDTIVLSAAPA